MSSCITIRISFCQPCVNIGLWAYMDIQNPHQRSLHRCSYYNYTR